MTSNPLVTSRASVSIVPPLRNIATDNPISELVVMFLALRLDNKKIKRENCTMKKFRAFYHEYLRDLQNAIAATPEELRQVPDNSIRRPLGERGRGVHGWNMQDQLRMSEDGTSYNALLVRVSTPICSALTVHCRPPLEVHSDHYQQHWDPLQHQVGRTGHRQASACLSSRTSYPPTLIYTS